MISAFLRRKNISVTIKKKRNNETNTSYLTQLEKKTNTLLSASSFFTKELSKTPQEKAPEKCSTAEKSFLEVVEKDEREIKEYIFLFKCKYYIS